jgi:hypothetical protein
LRRQGKLELAHQEFLIRVELGDSVSENSSACSGAETFFTEKEPQVAVDPYLYASAITESASLAEARAQESVWRSVTLLGIVPEAKLLVLTLKRHKRENFAASRLPRFQLARQTDCVAGLRGFELANVILEFAL